MHKLRKVIYNIGAFGSTIGVWFKTHFFKKTEVTAERYWGSRIMHPGHSIFEYNKRLFTLDLAEHTVEKGKKVIRIKDGETMYVTALNRNSAYKRLTKKGFKVEGRLRPLASEIHKAKILKPL